MIRCRQPATACLSLAFLLLSALPAWAQIYHVIQYGDQDGLPSAAVAGLAQDHEGFLWLATRSGLVRYDGVTWQTEIDGHELPDIPLGDVAVDAGGGLWTAATRPPAHVHHRPAGGVWTRRTTPVDAWDEWNVHTIVPGPLHDGERLVAVLSRDGVVHLLHGERTLRFGKDEPWAWVTGGFWEDDRLVLATSAGLVALRGWQDSPSRELIAADPAAPILAATRHPDSGDLIVVGRGWMGRVTGTGLTDRREVPAFDFGTISQGVRMAYDQVGGLYVSAYSRLYYLEPDGQDLTELSTANGLAGDGATDLVIDRAGPVWIGTPRGLSKLIDRRFHGYNHRQGLLTDEVSAVLPRPDGSVLLGHPGGMTVLNGDATPIDFASPYGRDARVTDFHVSHDGTIWLAAGRQGFGRLVADGKVEWLSEAWRIEGDVYAIAETTPGTMYVGTNKRLYRVVGGRAAEVGLPGLTLFSVRRLSVDATGALWVATGDHGVVRLDAEGHGTLFAGTRPQLDSTYGVFEASPGVHWVATSGGLGLARDGRIDPLERPSIERPVYTITRDTAGRTWIGTDLGVRVWDGESLRHYGARDGLLGSETNRDGLAIDARGRIWIGTDRGVSVHDPRLVSPHEFRPPVAITAVESGGVDRAVAEAFSIQVGTSDLAFRFRSVPFRNERRLRFQTRLEGLEDTWSEVAEIPTRTVRYAHLPPGEYRFGVRAVDAHGRVGDPALGPVVTVLPPLWQRWWFLVLGLLGVLALAGLVGQVVQGRRFAQRLNQDVAARTEALAASEQAVRRESQRLTTVLTSISDGVLAVGADGRIVLANLAASDLVGGEAGELVGRSIGEILPDLGLRLSARSDQMQHPVFSYAFERADGSTVELEISMAPLIDDDEHSLGWVLAFRDVTEQRRLEQESIRAQKLDSLGVLAGGLAHDFNNLMTVVLGHVSVLEDSRALDAADHTALARIRMATEEARGLTSQLLTFARGGAPHKELTDLAGIARRCGELVVSGSSSRLNCDLPDDLAHAEVDANQIQQLLSNLMINARQAMPSGGTITVIGRNVTRGGQPTVRIAVRDEGPGVAPELRDRIFEPYFSTKETGSGLGLSICYSIARRHGGSLALEHPSGGGAEFVVTLPASTERAVGARLTSPASAVDSPPSLRVLVLDDEEPVRDIMHRMLTRVGHEVEAVATGEEAIARYEAEHAAGRPYDLVVVDLTINHGLGGAEAFARIRELDPSVRGIVASGYSHDPVMAHHAEHGFAAALQKPFDKATLLRAVTEVCEVS